MYEEQDTRNQVWCTRNEIRGTRCDVTRYEIWGVRYEIRSTRYEIKGVRYKVLPIRTGYNVRDTGCEIPHWEILGFLHYIMINCESALLSTFKICHVRYCKNLRYFPRKGSYSVMGFLLLWEVWWVWVPCLPKIQHILLSAQRQRRYSMLVPTPFKVFYFVYSPMRTGRRVVVAIERTCFI